LHENNNDIYVALRWIIYISIPGGWCWHCFWRCYVLSYFL